MYAMSENVRYEYGIHNPNSVFVGGVPRDSTESELKEYFRSFGIVTGCKIVTDQKGSSRGYAFVTFESADDAKAVLRSEVKGLLFRNKRLNIGPAVKRYQMTGLKDWGQQQVAPAISVGKGGELAAYQACGECEYGQQQQNGAYLQQPEMFYVGGQPCQAVYSPLVVGRCQQYVRAGPWYQNCQWNAVPQTQPVYDATANSPGPNASPMVTKIPQLASDSAVLESGPAEGMVEVNTSTFPADKGMYLYPAYTYPLAYQWRPVSNLSPQYL